MKTVELKILCILFFAVFASAQVMPMTDFDLGKMVGKWYLVGFATNAKHFVKSYKADIKMGTAMLGSTEDVSFVVVLRSDGSCFRLKNLAEKTEIPGRFVFYNKRWGNDNDMRVVDAKFDEYAIVHTIKTKEGKSEVLNKLHSRTTKITDDLKEKFRQFCLDTGILEENIAILTKNGVVSIPVVPDSVQ